MTQRKRKQGKDEPDSSDSHDDGKRRDQRQTPEKINMEVLATVNMLTEEVKRFQKVHESTMHNQTQMLKKIDEKCKNNTGLLKNQGRQIQEVHERTENLEKKVRKHEKTTFDFKKTIEMYTLKREVESRERALILYDVEQLEESTAIRETANFMFRTLQMTKEEARRITVNQAYRIGARRGNRPRPMRIVVKSRDEVGVILRQATKYNKGRLVSRDQPLVIRQGRKRLMAQYNKN